MSSILLKAGEKLLDYSYEHLAQTGLITMEAVNGNAEAYTCKTRTFQGNRELKTSSCKQALSSQVLYTHQKQKKAKTWHDGVLRASGQSKKATLYDDKGSRIDSIYVAAGDITLGEQLESDRYYILVEDIKKESAANGSAIQQKSQGDALSSSFSEATKPHGSSSDRRHTLLSSQGRCSGLKRKISGFVPPRMVKDSKLDEGTQEVCYNNKKQEAFVTKQTLPNHEKHSQNCSRVFNKQMEADPSTFSPYQRQGEINQNSQNEGPSLGPYNTNTYSGNLNVFKSMGSPVDSFMNHLQKVCLDSQESTVSDSKLKSPWSVYGSNSSSPKTLNCPKLQETRNLCEDSESKLYNMKKSPVGKPNEVLQESVLEKPLTLESGVNSIINGEINANDRISKIQNFNQYNHSSDYTTKAPVSRHTHSALQPKRGMLEIMNLLKSKGAQQIDTLSGENDNGSAEINLTPLNFSEIESQEGKVQNMSINLDKEFKGFGSSTVLNKFVGEPIKCNKVMSESASLDQHDSLVSKQIMSGSVNSEELTETEDIDMDAGPSFTISFSPLSNVSSSDDETEQEGKLVEGMVAGSSSSVALETAGINRNKDISTEQIAAYNASDAHNDPENELRNTKTCIAFSEQTTVVDQTMVVAKHGIKQDTQEILINQTSTNNWDENMHMKKDIVDGITEVSPKTHKPNNCPEEKPHFYSKGGVTVRNDNKERYSFNTNDTSIIIGDEAFAEVKKVILNTENNNKYDSSRTSIREGNDFIDIIDNANTHSASNSNDGNFDHNSITSDKALSESSDRKTSPSQDTMDFSCGDTLSHCSNSQQFSDSKIPEIPDMTKKVSMGGSVFRAQSQQCSIESKDSCNSQEVSQQIPLASETLISNQEPQTKPTSNISTENGDLNIKMDLTLLQTNKCQDPLQYTGNKSESDEYLIRDSIYFKRKPFLKNFSPADKRDKNRPNISCHLSHRRNDNKRPETNCESILNQIDNHYRAHSKCEFSKINPLQYRNWNKIEADTDMCGTENLPPNSEEQVNELPVKINEKLKSYKISGSLCSQVSRDPLHQRRQWVLSDTFSPCQRLSDYGDAGSETSPCLFEDNSEEKVRAAPLEWTDSEYTVPEVCSIEPGKVIPLPYTGQPWVSSATDSTTKKCVFISDSDTSEENTPQPTHHFTGEESDEDYIYTQLYKPRPMVEEKFSDKTENRLLGPDSDKQKHPSIQMNILDKEFNKTPICDKEKLADSEDSQEYFTQPRSAVETQRQASGSLQLFRKKQRGALKSKPFDDKVTHISYQNFSVSPRVGASKQEDSVDCIRSGLNTSNLQTHGLNCSDCNKSDNRVFWDNSEVRKTYGDVVTSDDRKAVVEMLAERKHDIVYDKSNQPVEHRNENFAGKETDFSDTSLSSQEFAQVTNKSLKPLDEKTPSHVQNDCTNSSKWEKYNSQHSEEDVNLDTTVFKAKVKDFSVIEKPVKRETMKFCKHDNIIRTSGNLNLNHISPYAAVGENSLRMAKISKTNCETRVVSPVPNSFFSIDSFEQLLENDSLDFNDSELDRVLMTQTNNDRITKEHLDKEADVTADGLSKYGPVVSSDRITNVNGKKIRLSCVEENIKHDQNLSLDKAALETNTSLIDTKRKSSDLQTSFSLDDSFMASNTYYKTVTSEIENRPAFSLRAPWKDNLSGDRNESNNKANNDTESLIESYDSTNPLDSDSGKLKVKVMGNDGDKDFNYSESQVALKSEHISESNYQHKNINIKSLINMKNNSMPNTGQIQSNSFEEAKTDIQREARYSPHTPDTDDSVSYRTISSQFKNPLRTGDGLQKTYSEQSSNRLSKRFKPPTLVKSSLASLGRQGLTSCISRGKLKNPSAEDLQAEIFSSSMSGELLFPSQACVQSAGALVRQVAIPTSFKLAGDYKNILVAAVTEYLNLQLYDLAKKYHHALSKIDTSELAGTNKGVSNSDSISKTPRCQCGAAAKIIQVKKQGPNNGRFFYACNGARNQQCKFFQWLDQTNRGGFVEGRRKISDPHSLITHMKSQRVQFYSQCSLVSRYRESIKDHFKSKFAKRDSEKVHKKQLYLRLSHKGHSSLYSKDDIWVISQDLDFNVKSTFIARSTYFGPTSSNEVEIDPIVGYSPSNWGKEAQCHALLAGNATTELSCLDNIKDHITPQSPPVIPSLLNRESQSSVPTSGYQVPRMVTESNRSRNIYVHSEEIDELVRAYIEDYHLNEDQAEAIKRVGSMFSVEKSDSTDSVLLIHGVFGAGKSFLLSVIVLFLVKVFQRNDLASLREPFPWKLLISSTTNVAVDRILRGLLELGFEDFIRVGSVKKIAKPVLPYSVHATGTDNQELKDFQEMLRSGELTSAEKQSVRQGIDKLRKGENKKKLAGVRVVGVTCASCLANCISNMQFPVVLLDECSQMTEPSSLLPIARFGCQKLLLVGDPKQLDPTIQGSDAANECGLEQTLFDRLIKMGYLPTLLRTQYRCHPDISAVANKLFYSGMLLDGVSAEQRSPLLPELPTVCFYDVDRGQECCEMAGSYYNEQEAQFVVFLIKFVLSCDIEPSSVGVITLYRSQMARITDLLNTGITGENKEIKGVQVSTVDAFQGGEKDIIILSTVRSQATGFIDNDKRTNVALTRARHHLFIVGNYNNLSRNTLWEKILNHCRGFPNGIQSAEEARHNLNAVLERLKEENDHKHKENDSSKTSQDSKKDSQRRKSATKRKRKKSENIELSPVSSMSLAESIASQTPHSQPESLPAGVKRKRNKPENDSPDFSLSPNSGGIASVRSPEDVEGREVTITLRTDKKSRFSNRINPDLFYHCEDNDFSDDDLMPFSN